MGQITVGPHKFQRLGRLWRRKSCRACYVHRDRHPVRGWVPARPLGDKTKALLPVIAREEQV